MAFRVQSGQALFLGPSWGEGSASHSKRLSPAAAHTSLLSLLRSQLQQPRRFSARPHSPPLHPTPPPPLTPSSRHTQTPRRPREVCEAGKRCLGAHCKPQPIGTPPNAQPRPPLHPAQLRAAGEAGCGVRRSGFQPSQESSSSAGISSLENLLLVSSAWGPCVLLQKVLCASGL